jgi:UDPglucose--hexose-1-phosphate uridylyltransferase
MRPVGAHEILVENPSHTRQLWDASDAAITQFLKLVAQRIQDLKRDQRFKFITVSKDQGSVAGQEFDHPTSQITATTFVPRRVLYELRACREYFEQKERCVFCDILSQEERQAVRMIETRGDYVACCPYAPRVPYETWILPRHHEAAFEREALRHQDLSDLASLLRRTLRRICSIADAFHMVLHTAPNVGRTPEVLGYWRTIEDDYHWHIEILPVLPGKRKSYRFKETYHSDVTPETAAARLRAAPAE